MRKTVDFIATDGRDKGRRYVITEMPALQAEWWGMRALLALAKSDVDIGAIAGMGMAGVAAAGFRALAHIDPLDARPLFDEMLACAQIAPDPAHPAFLRPLTGDDDVEEVSTLLELRRAIFELHTSFLQSAAPSALPAQSTTTTEASPGRIRRTRPAR